MKYNQRLLLFLFTFFAPLAYAQRCEPPIWANDRDKDKDAPEGWIVRTGIGESSNLTLVSRKAIQNAAANLAQSVKLKVDAYNNEVVSGANGIDMALLDGLTRFTTEEILTGLEVLQDETPCLLENGIYRKYVLLGYHVDKKYVDRMIAYEARIEASSSVRVVTSTGRVKSTNRRAGSGASKKLSSRKDTAPSPRPNSPSIQPAPPICKTPRCSPKGKELDTKVRTQSPKIRLEGGLIVPVGIN